MNLIQGLTHKPLMVIDRLIKEITVEYNITTIVVTHDMNSVMEIGDHIVYLHQGRKQWEGSNKDIIFSKDELLNKFIFASEFLQDAKEMRMMDMNNAANQEETVNRILFMKKIFFMLLLAFIVTVGMLSYAQEAGADMPPFMKTKKLPEFTIFYKQIAPGLQNSNYLPPILPLLCISVRIAVTVNTKRKK